MRIYIDDELNELRENTVYIIPGSRGDNYYLCKIGNLRHIPEGVANYLCFGCSLPVVIVRR